MPLSCPIYSMQHTLSIISSLASMKPGQANVSSKQASIWKHMAVVYLQGEVLSQVSQGTRHHQEVRLKIGSTHLHIHCSTTQQKASSLNKEVKYCLPPVFERATLFSHIQVVQCIIAIILVIFDTKIADSFPPTTWWKREAVFLLMTKEQYKAKQSKAKQSKIMSGHDANPIYASCQFSQQCI